MGLVYYKKQWNLFYLERNKKTKHQNQEHMKKSNVSQISVDKEDKQKQKRKKRGINKRRDSDCKERKRCRKRN